jgi:Domain of unknown function (DUF4403)
MAAMHWGKIAIVAGIVVLVGIGAVVAMRWLWPGAASRPPALVEVPPLRPLTRSSRIVLPTTITLAAIGDLMERAPRDLSGKLDLPSLPGSSAELEWSLARGPFAVAAQPDELTVSGSLSGSLRGASQIGLPPGGGFNIPGLPPGFPRPPGGLFDPGRNQPQGSTQGDRSAEQRIDISGSVVLTARPTLQADWHLKPNLAAQVTIAEASISFFGRKFSLSNQLKPLVERSINEQVASLQDRFANDSLLEQSARQEWAKMCHSVPLGAAPGAPNLWLEVRPTRAFAAQPRIDSSAVTLTFGVEAETRIVPNETKPECVFPSRLELVQQMEQGQVSIAVPIDVPFTEISRLIEAQLKGKTFPEDRSGGFTATVQSVALAASGNRLLMSLRVKGNETRTWFGFGAEATIHVWGRPVLDRSRQVLRIDDITVDIESQAAFGLLGLAARTAVPSLERMLAENATIDLVPLAGEARRNIAKAVADFQRSSEGVRVDAVANELRLTDIEFDSKTLRVIAEADGTARVTVTSWPTR